MKRQFVLLATILVAFLGAVLTGQSSRADDQQQRKVITAIGEDLRGNSEILYFAESEDGTRTQITEAEARATFTAEGLNAQSAQVAVVGTKRVAVIITHFTGEADQLSTVVQAQEVFFGAGGDSVASRYARESFGQLILTGQVFEVTIPAPTGVSGCDRGIKSHQAARQAAGAGGYDYYVLVVPPQPGCPWAGLADVPGTSVTLFGNFSARIAQHELGHAMGGLMHSSFGLGVGACSSSMDALNCEYGDFEDVMGSNLSRFDSLNKVRWGWIPQTDVVRVNSSNHDQTVTLFPGSGPTGVRDIEIPLGDSTGYEYHLEYHNGRVFVRLGRPNLVEQFGTSVFNTWLIQPNGSPNPVDASGAAMAQGEVYEDSIHQIRIEVLSVNSAQAQVRVTLPEVPPPHINNVTMAGKKLTVTGDNFGEGAVVLINGVDISGSVKVWIEQTDKKIKLKVKKPSAIFISSPGQNTAQVRRSDGVISDNFVIQ